MPVSNPTLQAATRYVGVLASETGNPSDGERNQNWTITDNPTEILGLTTEGKNETIFLDSPIYQVAREELMQLLKAKYEVGLPVGFSRVQLGGSGVFVFGTPQPQDFAAVFNNATPEGIDASYQQPQNGQFYLTRGGIHITQKAVERGYKAIPLIQQRIWYRGCPNIVKLATAEEWEAAIREALKKMTTRRPRARDLSELRRGLCNVFVDTISQYGLRFSTECVGPATNGDKYKICLHLYAAIKKLKGKRFSARAVARGRYEKSVGRVATDLLTGARIPNKKFAALIRELSAAHKKR